jgi:hypothetical protein
MSGLRAAYPRPVLLALAAATVLYSWIFLASREKLIYTDEVAFARDFERFARGDWAQAFIPHPPLYTWLGSLTVRLIGDDVPVMRLVGGSAYVATLVLLPLVCYALSRERAQAWRAGLLAVMIWAIHPLALQGSLLLDIDNTVFAPALLLFVLALVGTEGARGWQRALAVGCAFSLLLWAKFLPTAPIVAGIGLLVTLLRRRQVGSATLGLLLGLLFFVISLALFGALSRFPIAILTTTLLRVQTPAAGFGRTFARTLMGGGILSVWVGLPLLLAYLVYAVARATKILRTLQFAASDILLFGSAVGLVLYTAGSELPMGFPRYHYPIFLLMVIWLALAVNDDSTRFAFLSGRATRLGTLGATVAAAAFFALVVPDPLLPQYQLTFETNELIKRLQFGAQLQIATVLLPGLALVAGHLALGRVTGAGQPRKRPGRGRRLAARAGPAMVAAAISFCLASWLVLDVAQARADYSTIYEYGRRGGAEVSALVRARTRESDRVVAPMEILFHANREGTFVLVAAGPDASAASWLALVPTERPAAYVLTTKEDGRYTQVTRDPDVLAYLDRCYPDRAAIGSYLVYFQSLSFCP